MSKYKPKDEIIVKVGEKEYSTIIDERGVQRFKKNSCLEFLQEKGFIDLNNLAIAFCEGSFDQRDYLEFNMMLGYSVCGIAEFECFEDMEIENPVWENDDLDNQKSEEINERKD